MSKDTKISPPIPPQIAAWCAGFFDGEGYVGIVRRAEGRFQLSVSIRQCDREPLEYVKAFFGGSISMHSPGSDVARIAHSWTVSRRKAVPFLSAVQPFLVRPIMKERVHVALAFQSQVEVKGKYEDDYLPRQKVFFDLMETLKTRGGKR